MKSKSTNTIRDSQIGNYHSVTVKLVYSNNKKVLIRSMGCKRCENMADSNLLRGVF